MSSDEWVGLIENSVPLTRQWTIGCREADVVKPSHGNESPAGRGIACRSRRENGKHDSRDGEEQAVGQVTTDHRPPTTDLVDEQDTTHLRDQGKNGRNSLVLERAVGVDAHLREDSVER